MARPRKEDRSQVQTVTLTIRLTEDESKSLDDLVAQRRAELAPEGGTCSAASVVRGLILRAVVKRTGRTGGTGRE